MTNVSLIETCWRILDESTPDLTPEHLTNKLELDINVIKQIKFSILI